MRRATIVKARTHGRMRRATIGKARTHGDRDCKNAFKTNGSDLHKKNASIKLIYHREIKAATIHEMQFATAPMPGDVTQTKATEEIAEAASCLIHPRPRRQCDLVSNERNTFNDLPRANKY